MVSVYAYACVFVHLRSLIRSITSSLALLNVSHSDNPGDPQDLIRLNYKHSKPLLYMIPTFGNILRYRLEVFLSNCNYIIYLNI